MTDAEIRQLIESTVAQTVTEVVNREFGKLLQANRVHVKQVAETAQIREDVGKLADDVSAVSGDVELIRDDVRRVEDDLIVVRSDVDIVKDEIITPRDPGDLK